LNKIESYQQFAQSIPHAPKFDIWVQHQNGSHRFDIMDHSKYPPFTFFVNCQYTLPLFAFISNHPFSPCIIVVLKMYTNVTNIIVRLSCPESAAHPSRECESNAVLLNAHFDTTLGSPGASDDGSGIAVMLEIIRIMSQQSWDGYKNSVVFRKYYGCFGLLWK
jgi:Peptidase family M28